MGIIAYSLLWVMQDLHHQPYCYSVPPCVRESVCREGTLLAARACHLCLSYLAESPTGSEVPTDLHTQRVHIHIYIYIYYHDGLRSQKIIPKTVLGTQFQNSSMYGPSWIVGFLL